MTTTHEDDRGRADGGRSADPAPIGVLESIRRRGRVWRDLAAQYGVTNPDPPWRITLEATCDILAAESCANPDAPGEAAPGVLPALERRAEEDDLSATLYADVPFPERQLLALAHSMIRRGLIDEEELKRRVMQVHERLNAV
jgi:hypothetical protein